MYKNKVTGLTEYETFAELLQADIVEFTEDDSNYYIRTKPEQIYENRIWVVDKNSKNVSCMFFTDYFSLKVTPVNISEIKKRIA